MVHGTKVTCSIPVLNQQVEHPEHVISHTVLGERAEIKLKMFRLIKFNLRMNIVLRMSQYLGFHQEHLFNFDQTSNELLICLLHVIMQSTLYFYSSINKIRLHKTCTIFFKAIWLVGIKTKHILERITYNSIFH